MSSSATQQLQFPPHKQLSLVFDNDHVFRKALHVGMNVVVCCRACLKMVNLPGVTQSDLAVSNS